MVTMRNAASKIKKEIAVKEELHLLISTTLGAVISLGSSRTALQDQFIKESLVLAERTRIEVDSLQARLHLAILFDAEQN